MNQTSTNDTFFSPQPPFDLIIIGGGIIGLAIAYEFSKKFPSKKIAILEKEKQIALHQTGRNSGVLHSGIYYPPNSLKAKLCQKGKNRLENFCRRHKINFEICGKIIIATDKKELPSLNIIWERSKKNQVDSERINPTQIKKLEPHAKGVAGIWVKKCGIVDYSEVCKTLLTQILEKSNQIFFNSQVNKIEIIHKHYLVHTQHPESNSTENQLIGKQVINCAGLYSDVISRHSGLNLDHQIIPFRGEYYQLKNSSKHLVKNLIYPVPDLKFPFLGVHFTRMMNGKIECGPNAVLAFGRESYSKWQIHFKESMETLQFSGFRKVAKRYWKSGLKELHRSFSKKAFVSSLQKIIPEITSKDLESAPSGIRAQSVKSDGNFIDDFYIKKQGNLLHIWNTPSPAATSSLEIARYILKFTGSDV